MSEPVFEEKLSAGEARFEAWRHRLGLVLGPLVGLLVAWLGGGGGEVGEFGRADRLAGIMAFTAIWWIGEAVPVAVTGLLAAAGCVLFGVAPAKQVFGAYGDPILFLFVGSFFIAEAMKHHQLGARLARAMARSARGRLSMLCALSGGAWLMSLWMSNSASTAVTLPIAVSVAAATKDRAYAAALVLAVAYGASMGGIGTPVGTPPNLIGIQQMEEAGLALGFLNWMSVGVPIGALMLLVLWVVLAWRFGLRRGQPLPEGFAGASEAGGPWSRGEYAVVTCFGVAVVGWLVPGVIEAAAPGSPAAKWTAAHLSEEVVALVAAAPLFFWPVGTAGGAGRASRPALTWAEARHIDWATILLFGSGILLGKLAGDSGLTASWGRALVDATGVNTLWTITAMVTAVAILLSELTSNTATATLIVPLAISLAEGAGVPVAPPALGATIGASFGFMLPISTAPNAMAYGTGLVSIPQMARAGVAFDVIGYVAVVAGLWLLCPLLGLT